MSRSLVSLSKLDNCGFEFNGGHGSFNLCNNNKVFGSCYVIDGLYRFKLHDQFYEPLLTKHESIGIKRSMLNGIFSYLWHKR